MPPKVWTGAISFGLVSVPIAVLGATEDHSVRFRRIHTVDNGLVRNRYWCEIEDREISYGEIGQGYEMAGGRIIPLTDEELRQLPLPTARAIELVGFLPAADVDPLRIGPGYYLQPQGSVAAKPYVLLRQALQRASKVAVARYAWHGRERLGLLRVRGDVIALHTLLWPDEIRDPARAAPGPVVLEPGEIDEAMTLVEIMSRDNVDGPEFTDHYTQALRQVVEAKQEHRRLPQAPHPAARPGQLVDLMATLQQSVDKARAARGEDAADVPDLPSTAQTKTATRKTAKKSPAQKASPRKPRHSV
ncbi:Ku protein [Streptomyces sp. NPDC058424]|uniref:non-homologous end joining protein Ku n=1 Tax=Streptomyces sp. NPDC058424 TaxID=3346491 RepID=UPI00366077BD